MSTRGAAALLVAVGAVLVGANPARADTQFVTVTPSTGLVNGQNVAVAGSGFSADETVYVAECNYNVISSVSPNDCDTATLVTSTTDSSGALTIPTFTIRAGAGYLDNDHGSCTSSSPCVVGIVNSFTDPSEAGVTTIAFAKSPLAKTVTSVTAKPKSVRVGQKITVFAATSHRKTNGALTGKVKFADNGKTFATATETSSGRAKATLKISAKANHITATYTGSSRYARSVGTRSITARKR